MGWRDPLIEKESKKMKIRVQVMFEYWQKTEIEKLARDLKISNSEMARGLVNYALAQQITKKETLSNMSNPNLEYFARKTTDKRRRK